MHELSSLFFVAILGDSYIETPKLATPSKVIGFLPASIRNAQTHARQRAAR